MPALIDSDWTIDSPQEKNPMVNLIDQVVQSAAMGNDASTVIPIAEISGNSRNRFEPETMLQGLS